MVFQNYSLYPHMSVAQNMAYALKIAGTSRAQINERVAVGRAIVREHVVFLFDEPLSNLDAKLRVQMRLEIQRLHARFATTNLYVTYDQIEAMTLAQRVIVMNKGTLNQSGAPTEVYERPATVFVASCIGSLAMKLLSGRVSEDGASFVVAGDGPSLSLSGVERELHGREIILGIRPEHMTPGNANAASATLEVDSAELLGANNLAHGKWGKHDVAARLPHAHRPERGERLTVSLPPSQLHFFDPASGLRAN